MARILAKNPARASSGGPPATGWRRSRGIGPLMYLAAMSTVSLGVPAGVAFPPTTLVFAFCCAVIAPATADTGDTAISVYAGRMTDEDWIKSLSGRADWVDSRLIALAGARTLWRDAPRHWSFEVEGNTLRHFGLQDHWEFNALGNDVLSCLSLA